MLTNKNVVIGVSGGIAAYKAVDVVSMLKKLGANVDVIMTKSACEFVTPLTFRSIAHSEVCHNMFKEPKNWDIKHVALAAKADIFVVCPATANIIGKIAYGIADDMLSTTVMAAKCKVIIAPAMNTAMYENVILQGNINKLKSLGFIFVEPVEGRLACGCVGKGKMAAPDRIVEEIVSHLAYPKDMAGINVLVTAGPTYESIDPIRFITNHSTGKMGYAISNAAKYRGANVTLVSGPTMLNKIDGVDFIEVRSAVEMYDAVMSNYRNMDIIVKSAAVGDFRPAEMVGYKIKKNNAQLNIKLVENPDILKELGSHKSPRQILVGFCMETDNLIESATQKLESKNLDLIVANNINHPRAGFAVDTNTVTIIDNQGGISPLPNMPKSDLANKILDKALKGFTSFPEKEKGYEAL